MTALLPPAPLAPLTPLLPCYYYMYMRLHTTGHCAGRGVVGLLPPSPLPSYVHINVSVEIAVLQRGEVLDALERGIAAFSRPVDPAYPEGDQQVRCGFVVLCYLLKTRVLCGAGCCLSP